MSTNNVNNPNEELEFERMMEERIKDNFGSSASGAAKDVDARLKAMNKKLPSWNLEPPYTFIK